MSDKLEFTISRNKHMDVVLTLMGADNVVKNIISNKLFHRNTHYPDDTEIEHSSDLRFIIYAFFNNVLTDNSAVNLLSLDELAISNPVIKDHIAYTESVLLQLTSLLKNDGLSSSGLHQYLLKVVIELFLNLIKVLNKLKGEDVVKPIIHKCSSCSGCSITIHWLEYSLYACFSDNTNLDDIC